MIFRPIGKKTRNRYYVIKILFGSTKHDIIVDLADYFFNKSTVKNLSAKHNKNIEILITC